LLFAAWAVTLASFAGAAAWLYLTSGHAAPQGGGGPRVTMSLNAFQVAEPVGKEDAALDGQSPVTDGESRAAGEPEKPAASAGTKVAAAGLHPHPDPLLIEKSDLGPLPIIGKDGRAPWRVYARPFSSIDSRPRIAVVLTGLGVSEQATKSAIDTLPGAVTLSFAPFTKNLSDWIDKSRGAGHEVLIDLPMEPMDFPRSDPGPHTLLTNVPIDQNLRQLGWILSRATGYVGVAIYMGSGLVMKPRVLSPILTEIKARGLMVVDSGENPMGATSDMAKELSLAVAVGDAVIDHELAAGKIDHQLAELETRARQHGAALALGRPYPVTVGRLKEWTASLEKKGIALAPVSALPPQQRTQ
jgi:polysaccharide deacetylase 2 family uncharacterized protein YibQ